MLQLVTWSGYLLLASLLLLGIASLYRPQERFGLGVRWKAALLVAVCAAALVGGGLVVWVPFLLLALYAGVSLTDWSGTADARKQMQGVLLVGALGAVGFLSQASLAADKQHQVNQAVAAQRAEREAAEERARVAALPPVLKIVFARTFISGFDEPGGGPDPSARIDRGSKLYVTEKRGEWYRVRPYDETGVEDYWVRASDTINERGLAEEDRAIAAEGEARAAQERAAAEQRQLEIQAEGAATAQAVMGEVAEANRLGLVRERIQDTQVVVVNGRIWNMMSNWAQGAFVYGEGLRFQRGGGSPQVTIVEEMSGNVLFSNQP